MNKPDYENLSAIMLEFKEWAKQQGIRPRLDDFIWFVLTKGGGTSA